MRGGAALRLATPPCDPPEFSQGRCIVRIKTMAVAVGVSAPLILSGSVDAGFVGITTTSKPNEFGLLVCNVYAEFDTPGEDHMISVAATSLQQVTIEVITGTVEATACPWCGKANNFKGVEDYCLEEGNTFTCDHCKRIFQVARVKPVTLVYLKRFHGNPKEP